MNVDKLHKQIEGCREELRYLETELVKPGTLLAGTVIQRYSVCGKVGCRCLEGQRHGPYPALSRPDGQVVYLNRKRHSTVAPYVERYQKFQRHLSRWRKTTRKLDELFSRLRQDRLMDIEEFPAHSRTKSANGGISDKDFVKM